MAKIRAILSVAILISFLTGCASLATVPVRSGTIVTPDVTITAEDNSFVLRSGESFAPPPFQSTYNLSDDTGPERAANWPRALAAGAKRVTVQYGKSHLYGVLALNVHYAGMTVPGAYRYDIEIPQQFVDAANGGRPTVVYELLPTPNGGGANFLSWTLWLSDKPFRP